MKKIFIDCGFHHGEGLRHFIDHLSIDKEWLVYAFEANPACEIQNRFFKIIKDEFGEAIHYGGGWKSFDFAVWTELKTVLFRQENHFKSESGSPADGRSIVDGWASQIDDLKGVNLGLESPICVQAIDFSWFVEAEYTIGHFNRTRNIRIPPEIYCKMDIEGAEFPVLRKMLKEGTVKYLKKLWVEFHEQHIPGESASTKRELINQLSQFTEVEEWH